MQSRRIESEAKTQRASAAPQRGFTLIELVIVIAIIAILAIMAIPFFAGRAAREQIKESSELVEFAKKAVTAYYNESKERQVPANNEAAKLPAADKIVGNYVSSVTVKDGAVNVKFGNNAHPDIKGKVLTYRPIVAVTAANEPKVPMSYSSSSWLCAGKKVPEKMEVVGTNVTDVPPAALPLECR
ncbi:MAG: pilin [Betaproteobacteria bacterium]|nr:pilin [Betaproteobacteria bacterium]